MTLNRLRLLTLTALFLLGVSPLTINYTNAASVQTMTTNGNVEPEDQEDEKEDDEEEEDGDEEEEETDNNEQQKFVDVDDEEIVVNAKDGKEEIFEVPEGMIIDMEKMLSDYNAKQYLITDTTCKMRDVNPIYEQEVYLDRLKRMPTAMEMPWNEVVQKFIDRYSGKLRHSVSYMLGASNFYMPIFEQALEVYGLPLELK